MIIKFGKSLRSCKRKEKTPLESYMIMTLHFPQHLKHPHSPSDQSKYQPNFQLFHSRQELAFSRHCWMFIVCWVWSTVASSQAQPFCARNHDVPVVKSDWIFHQSVAWPNPSLPDPRALWVHKPQFLVSSSSLSRLPSQRSPSPPSSRNTLSGFKVTVNP